MAGLPSGRSSLLSLPCLVQHPFCINDGAVLIKPFYLELLVCIYSGRPFNETGPSTTRNGRLLSILHFGIWNPSNGPPGLRRIFDQIRPNSQFPLVRFRRRARCFQKLGGFGPFSTLFPSFFKDRTPDKKQTGGCHIYNRSSFFQKSTSPTRNSHLKKVCHTRARDCIVPGAFRR